MFYLPNQRYFEYFPLELGLRAQRTKTARRTVS